MFQIVICTIVVYKCLKVKSLEKTEAKILIVYEGRSLMVKVPDCYAGRKMTMEV